MAREEWKMRVRPRKQLLPVDAAPEQIAAANEAYERALEEDARNESALLAEAVGEIAKIALSFDDVGRHDLACVLAVLGPEPDKEEPWHAAAESALESIKQLATAYIVAQQDRAKQGCPDCAKRPEGAVTETTVTRDEKGLVVRVAHTDGKTSIVRVPWETLDRLDLEDVADERRDAGGRPA